MMQRELTVHSHDWRLNRLMPYITMYNERKAYQSISIKKIKHEMISAYPIPSSFSLFRL